MTEIVLQPGSPGGSYFNNSSPVYGSPDGIYGEGIAWQVVNSASIAGSSVGVYLAAGGSLTQTDTGYIFGTTAGVEISNGAGTVSNAGTIIGYTGVNLGDGGTVANGGLIAGSAGGAGSYSRYGRGGDGGAGGTGIVLSQGGSIGNTGTIAGGQGGTGGNATYNYGGAGGTGGAGIVLWQSGSIGNTGTIAGGTGGAGGAAFYAGAGGTGGSGIVLSQGGSVGNSGMIVGGEGGAGSQYRAFGQYFGFNIFGGNGGAGGVGIILSQGGSIGNSGMIVGGEGGAGGNTDFYRGGDGAAGGIGIVLSQGGSIGNSGMISGGEGGAGGNAIHYGYRSGNGGVGGIGIVLSQGGSIGNTGTIAGGAGGAAGTGGYRGAGAGAAGIAISLADGGTVSNGDATHPGALIEGGIGIQAYGAAGATVTNYGTIEGTSGTAVQFAGSNDVLIVEAGSKLIGSAAGGGGTLDLAGDNGPGSLSSFSQYSGFSQIAVLAGADWTLTGTNTVPSLTDSGSLVNSGSLTSNLTLSAGGYLANAATGTIAAGTGPNLIVDGSFETPNVGGGYGIFGNGSVPGWTSNNNEIEIDYTPILGGNAYAGNQSMELNGNTFDTVSQTVSGLTPGASYTLSWAYSARGGYGAQQTDVSFGGSLVATDTSTASQGFGWALNSITVIATSASETLSFAAINVGGSGGGGNEIDAVSLAAQDQTAVSGSGGPSTVVNAGTIAGSGAGSAVVLASGGTVTNGDASHPGALIEGGIGIDASGAAGVTVTNYGTIEGTGGTALQFAGSNDVLVVEAGSTLVGSAAGGGGTLDLAGDNGAGTLAGSQYTGFAQLAVLAGATWTLTNSGDVGTFSLAGGSSLEFEGATGSGQTLDFTGNAGLARLDAPSQFQATIADFRVGDTVDLANTAATSLSYSGTASGGTLTVLNANATVATLAFSGPYGTGQFQLSADGKGGSDIALAPPTVASQSYAINENTLLGETAAQGVLAGASPDTVIATLVANPAYGTVTLNQDGSFTYTPDANFYGSDSFTYTGSYPAGEGTSAAATATIAVADTTVPSETVAGPYTGDENTAIALSGLSVSASPNADDPLSTVLGVAHGILTVGNQTGATITLSGTAATIDAALAGASYTAALNYTGTDTLSLTTTDTVDQNQATANAGIDINPQNVTVGNGNSTVALGSGNDSVTLGTGSDTVTGGNGNDTISVSGGAGNDSVTLGNGKDSVTLANGSNTVTLGNGNDTVMLGQGANTVTLGTGSDTVIVGNNNNTITAVGSATSTDSISAGNGNNTLNLGAGTYDIVLGNGNNTVNMAGGTYDVTAGHGTDLFVFDTPQALLDMKFASNDELVFRNSGFDFGSINGTGTATPQQIPGSLFSPDTDGTFATSADRFAYNAGTGQLYYDSQGNAAGSPSSLVATLSNHPHLTAANLFFMA